MKQSPSWTGKASSIFDRLSELLALAGGVLIVGLMLLISVATISRYFFGEAMAWSTEIGAFSLLFITMLGGPLLARDNAHINVDILPNSLGPRGSKIVIIFASTAALLVSLFLGWHGLKSAIEAFYSKQMIVSMLRTPKYVMLAVITGGFFLIAAGFFKYVLKQLNSNDKA